MTDALAGAHLGEEAMPVLWREQVGGCRSARELADAQLALAAPQNPVAEGVGPPWAGR